MAAAQAPIAPTRPETPHLATVPPRRIDRGFYYDFDYPEGVSGAFNPPPHLSPAAPPAPRARWARTGVLPTQNVRRAKTLHPRVVFSDFAHAADRPLPVPSQTKT